jgi:Xaa-Pro aminopeptidase/Xaa-Pro dipeptidase
LSIFSERRRRLLEGAKGAHVVAATSPNLFYLTDFFGGGIGVVKPDRTVVVTSALEADRVKEVGHEVEVVKVKRRVDLERLALRELGRGEVIIDSREAFKNSKRFRRAPEVFLETRRTKDEEEVARIKKASRGLDSIFESLEKVIKPGKTEWEIGAEVLRTAALNEMTMPLSDNSLSPVIVATGPDGALPHSELTRRRVRRGDFVVVDIFFRYLGYHSDSTRTFAVGSVTSQMKKAYEAVRESQEYALGTIQEGTPCGDVSDAAVDVLKKHGVAKYLNHGIGHGVGIDIHELPSITKGNEVRLREGDVVTDEPGVYFKGKFGVRIEDTVLVGKKPSVLTRYTKDLVAVG